MISRAQILSTARTYMGTPFHHQGRVKGQGIDCIGLIVGVGQEVSGSFHDHTNYGRDPEPSVLLEHLRKAFVEIDKRSIGVGDVAVFWVTNVSKPRHVGIIGQHGGRKTLIHTHAKSQFGVVEVTLTGLWEKRICYGFRYPGVED